jgi:ubiquinone/menaquinone biosynthesis C-methylase UbiE
MDAHKIERQAIALHSRLAESFYSGYEWSESSTTRPLSWRQLFAYGRKRLDTYLFPALDNAGRQVLDVGCGTGHYISELRARGFQVCGVDGSRDMLNVARRNNSGANILEARVQQLPFPDESFDAAICIEVLRYVPDWTSCIGEIARVLRPGGLCLITVSPRLSLNGYWLLNWIDSIVSIPTLQHLKQFFTSSRQLRRVISAAGFERPIIRGLYFGPSSWVARIAPNFLPRYLRFCEPMDTRLVSKAWLSDFSNMCLVSARKQQ